MTRSPRFATLAVLTFVLGIAANALVFSVFHAVLLQPLPYPHANNLVALWESLPKKGISKQGFSVSDLELLKGTDQSFSSAAAYQFSSYSITGVSEPEYLLGAAVSAEFFVTLDARALLGRTLIPSDNSADAPPVVVISESMWRAKFGSAPNIIGKPVQLKHQSFTIVGVMGAESYFPFFTAGSYVWIPLRKDPDFAPLLSSDQFRVAVIARLKPTVSRARANATLGMFTEELGNHSSDDVGAAVLMTPLKEDLTSNTQSTVVLLELMAGLVLVVTCVNVAGLTFAQFTTVRRQAALQSALGASRGRVVQYFLARAAILGLAGGGGGLLLAGLSLPAVVHLLPVWFPRRSDIHVGIWVVAFSLVLSLLAGLLSGIGLSFQLARVQPAEALKETRGSLGTSAGQRRTLDLLVIGQTAVAAIVLIGAALLWQSLNRLEKAYLGFNPQNLSFAMLALPREEYHSPRQWVEFSDHLLNRAQSGEQLRNSAVMAFFPFSGFSSPTPFTLDKKDSGNRTHPTALFNIVSPQYFQVMGIPLLSGRSFQEEDRSSSTPVIIINKAFARRYFAGENVLGRHIVFSTGLEPAQSRRIVGIVGDVRDAALVATPGPEIYTPFAQTPWPLMAIGVRTRISAQAVANSLQDEVHNIDSSLVLSKFVTMRQLVDSETAPARLRAFLAVSFGLLALVLAIVGLYSILCYSVAQRTGELGLRMALGASRARVLLHVLGQGMRVLLAGLCIGCIAAIFATELLRTQLFGIGPDDPSMFAAALLILAISGVFACFLPAWRACCLDPADALRYE